MNEEARVLDRCVACDGTQLLSVVDFGNQPLANGFHRGNQTQRVFPLALKMCGDCQHCQLSHVVNPEILFKNYLYVSGTAKTAKSYFEEFATKVVRAHEGAGKLRVLDIACNDGSQLDPFKALGCETFGVDPASNLVPIAQQKGHTVINSFWNETVAEAMGHFDVIIAQNVLPHTAMPFEFLKAARLSCVATTEVFIQTSQMNMLFEGEFDTVYHEHISFFSVSSMQTLANRAGFDLVDVSRVDLHGGSAIFKLKLLSEEPRVNWPRVQEELSSEADRGLRQCDAMIAQFRETVESSGKTLKEIISVARAEGRGVVGFGAAAKSMTVLCVTGCKLDYVIDDNPLKQDLFTPGTPVPVKTSSALAEDPRSLLIIVLAWNFGMEIVAKCRSLRREKQGDQVLLKYIFSDRTNMHDTLHLLDTPTS